MKARNGPLADIRVIEFAGIGPGPLAGQLLADLGAEVIIVDRASAAADATDINRRNKTSLALNLKTAAGIEIALALIATADVLIEGFRPGVMEKLGLGPDVCLGRNPRLVYTRLTGWGQTGPLSRKAGHDINYMSLSGALAAIGHADRPPIPPLNLVADYGAGTMFALFGLLAALVERHGSGKGDVVDVAMSDGVPAMMGVFHAFLARGTLSMTRESNLLDGGAPFYRCYETSDGKAVSVGPIEPQFFAEFCEKTGLDPDLTACQMDKDAWPALRAHIDAVMRSRTRDDWAAIFSDSDACVAPVLTLQEAEAHPHNRARQVFFKSGGVLQASPAPRFARSTAGAVTAPVAPGSGADEILTGLGYSKAQIAALHGERVLT